MNDLPLLAIICFVAMISPGPDFILVTRNALLYPTAPAFATAAGIIAGCFVHATYCMLGLALIITKSIALFVSIKYAGALYLVFLGLKGIFSKTTSSHTYMSAEKSAISIRTAFLEGFFCNLLNPKLAVFLLSLFTQFVAVDAPFASKAIVAGIFILESALYWPLIVVVFQWRFVRRIFTKIQPAIDRIFGVLLVGMGIRIALPDKG